MDKIMYIRVVRGSIVAVTTSSMYVSSEVGICSRLQLMNIGN